MDDGAVVEAPAAPFGPGTEADAVIATQVLQDQFAGFSIKQKEHEPDISDSDRPIFHVHAKKGWINDPNGPLYFNGQYHIFYQHVPHTAKWDFGIVWGHAVSNDLVHWRHLPAAIAPTAGWLDQDGCFSGCAVEYEGEPLLLYTGVQLKTRLGGHFVHGNEGVPNQPFIEYQCAARPKCRGTSRDLPEWDKSQEPFLPAPPADLPIVGWRDPFIVKRGEGEEPWVMVLGSGLQGQGGTVMVYHSRHPLGPWKYEGLLCLGSLEHGAMWECPLLLELKPHPRSVAGKYARARTLGPRTPTTGRVIVAPGSFGLASASQSSLAPTASGGGLAVSGGGGGGGGGLAGRGSMTDLSGLGRAFMGHPSIVVPSDPEDSAAPSESESEDAGRGGRGGGMGIPGGAGRGGAMRRSASVASRGDSMSVRGEGDAIGFTYSSSRVSLANLAGMARQLARGGAAEGGGAVGAGAGTPAAAMRRVSSFKYSGASGVDIAATPRRDSDRGTRVSEDQPDRPVHLLCVSPDAPTNPVLYFLGPYIDGRFLLEEATGPHRLDLGDTLYAPNTFVDAKGRQVLWGWLQEKRDGTEVGYAGCLSVPRVVTVLDGRLHQEPLPELKRLRRGQGWYASWVDVSPEQPVPVERVSGRALDIEVIIDRGQASAAGLLFNSFSDDCGSAVVVYDWDRAMLEVIFEVPPRDAEAPGQIAKRVGGPVEVGEDEPVKLRVLIDHSCVEIYESAGHVLSTRIYRGRQGPLEPGAALGIEFVAYGGTAHLVRVEAWEMGTSWEN